MRSLLSFFGLGGDDVASAESAGDTRSVRKIVSQLEGLEPERARTLAAFAFLLGRVAHADLDIGSEEIGEMERLVQEVGGLTEPQAVLVVEIARSQNQLLGHVESFQVAREYRGLTDKDERLRLLHCLFAVSAADDSISAAEEKEVRQIAEELGFSHREFIDVRSEYNEKRSVIQRLDR
ncbi:MAG: TerB family tellurite resistance protein [Acidobacteriota bacterium]